MEKQWVFYSETAQEDLHRILEHSPTRDESKALLGGLGTGLVRMVGAGLPVPPSFTLLTEACSIYHESGSLPEGLWEQVKAGIHHIEQQMGKRLGDPDRPLLVSVHTSARQSLPGMRGRVAHIGLNDETCAALAKLSSDPRYAYEKYCGFIATFSDIVKGYKRSHFEERFEALRIREGVNLNGKVSEEIWADLLREYKAMYQTRFGETFPSDPYRQLELALRAGLHSWYDERAMMYREKGGFPHNWGVSVIVTTDVFSNFGEDSVSGMLFCRNPATGHRHLHGEYSRNTPFNEMYYNPRAKNDIHRLSQEMPAIYSQLLDVAQQSEREYLDMQLLEFIIEQGQFWLLASWTGKRSAAAAVKIAVDLANEGVISKEVAVHRVAPEALTLLPYPVLESAGVEKLKAQGRSIRGKGMSPSVAVGQLVIETSRAEALASESIDYILARETIEPADIQGVLGSRGVLSLEDSITGTLVHVCLGNNTPAIAVGGMDIDLTARTLRIGDQVIHEGEVISMDGGTGEIFLGEVPMIAGTPSPELKMLLTWIEENKGATA